MSDAALGIECAGISRSYGSRQVLSDLHLEVRPGQLTVLLGSNGAGKTTLMKILATLLLPTAGKASIMGLDVVHESQSCRRLMGFVPAEERSFHGRLTVMQNLEFFAALRGLSSAVCRERAEALLCVFALEGHARARFSELSSGMKQSLGLVRGLLHAPPVLLLDEPTRSLSPDMAKRAQNLLQKLAREEGRTILLATHNLGEAEALADQVAILHGGRILAKGSPSDLFHRHGLQGSNRIEALFQHVTSSKVTP
jgi:ABC-2 type transport system ATP-binding protein